MREDICEQYSNTQSPYGTQLNSTRNNCTYFSRNKQIMFLNIHFQKNVYSSVQGQWLILVLRMWRQNGHQSSFRPACTTPWDYLKRKERKQQNPQAKWTNTNSQKVDKKKSAPLIPRRRLTKTLRSYHSTLFKLLLPKDKDNRYWWESEKKPLSNVCEN